MPSVMNAPWLRYAVPTRNVPSIVPFVLSRSRNCTPYGFERLLAVKRILRDRAKDPELVRMLIDEARNAAALAHHRIVQVFDIELRDGVLFYVMEYLHGQTLAAVVARAQRLPLEAAI